MINHLATLKINNSKYFRENYLKKKQTKSNININYNSPLINCFILNLIYNFKTVIFNYHIFIKMT